MKRSEAREKAFKILFQMEFNQDFIDDIDKLMVDEELKGVQGEYVRQTLIDIVEYKDEIDELIKANLKGWLFERISKTTLAILRLGVYEIVFNEDVPDISAIDEAVKLTSRYSDDKDVTFVNGVLNKIHKDRIE